MKEHNDHWSSDGQIHILDGKGYCVAPNLQTICIGEVDDRWKPTETVFDAPFTHSNAKSDVPKSPLVSNHSPEQKYPDLASDNGVGFGTKNQGGRPRKKIAVDRIKELSGEGMVIRDIAKLLKIGRSTVSRVLSGQR